ncbi:MAG: lyase family protein [Planctomycetota bacterium]
MKSTKKEYAASHEHRRHGPGAPEAEECRYYNGRLASELKRMKDAMPARMKTDLAWTVMLHKQKLISKAVAARLLKALQETGAGGEDLLKKKLDGDEDTASAVNLGRTLQEPMSRLQLREKLLDILDLVIKSLGTILDVAEVNVDTVMAGQTHLSHAQPTTYAAYLIAIHDGLARGLEQLEMAYKHVNQNSAGCGACSGTGWPVDRYLVTELLGFDSLVEPTYDCEPGQDHALTILLAMTNVAVLLSRSAMDFNIWGMEEIMMVHVDPGWRGVSSMMPQKAIPGSQFERVRLEGSDVIGCMITGVVSNKGEPYSDMLPIYEAWRSALEAMCHLEKAMGFFNGLLKAVTPDKKRMLQFAREGFSATPDLAVKLIRDKGYGGRRAHRICATMVRIARERGIKACEATGKLLDEAARIADEKPPRLSTKEVRDALDPVKFVKRHDNVGDPHPDESRRMIAKRREALAVLHKKHGERLAKLDAAEKKLATEVKAIMDEG